VIRPFPLRTSPEFLKPAATAAANYSKEENMAKERKYRLKCSSKNKQTS
jgi:hypothetical protein